MTKLIALAGAGLLVTSVFLAQNKPPTYLPLGDTSLLDVIITGTKFPEKKKNVVQRIDIINNQYIQTTNAQNSGDLLQSTGNVFVQKSQQGGSSPVVRGFEASRVLLMVDGIRMNNAIYRSGHLQNAITVDQNMLERVEVLYGPGSTLHGSDALGGVVAFKTIDPRLAPDGKKSVFSGAAFTRYSSANSEKTGHAHVSLDGKKLGALISATYSDFGDLRMGDNYPNDYPDFGRRSYYVERINGIDSVVKNNDDRVQRFSGYKQWDIMGKLLFQQNENISHLLNMQFSNSSNVPRYDRLQDIRNGNLRFAEWYYGPQKRNLFAYTFNARLHGFFNQFRLTASYQDTEESRYQRDRNNPQRQSHIENVGVAGFYADLRKGWGKSELHVGTDIQLNDVKSQAFRMNINDGTTSALDTRYPEKNKFNSFALYAQHLLKIGDGKLVLNDGIRVQATRLHSTVIDNTTSFRPFTDLTQNPTGVSGNLGLVYMPNTNVRITAGAATGFRAPNIDDLTKIFESSTANRQLIVPNPGINPEKTITPELGITIKAGQVLTLEAGAFYTWFKDAIVLDRFPLEGKDSTVYNGTTYLTLAAQNAASGKIHGFNVAATVRPFSGMEFYSTFNLTSGTFTQADGSKVPMDHMPPNFGKTSLRYSAGKWMVEAWSMYNGWKHIEDYNPNGEDNAQYATADGMPAWTTFNLRGQVVLAGHLMIQLGVENITDRNYRVFASGFSAPGRNIVAALRYNW